MYWNKHVKQCDNSHGSFYCKGVSASFQKRFEQAQQDGDLPQHVDAAILSRYIGTVLQGMSVQANNGASTEDLYAVADMVLQNFPKA